ncbi:hypothetical protein AVEN_196100-1 [Araneus ventricosus]|uniref:Uncharacterized protein n=1 Tax=Araneus ventricosus TaxID=182803 RepID=A0A4Y2HKM6_ARAVE|nr:hypothetical protein AVEN_196100-1 [Araneus ventricosus]
MLILWWKGEFYRGFNRSQAKEPRRGKLGNYFDVKTKRLENTRNMAPSQIGAEISRSFERLLYGFLPIGEDIKSNFSNQESVSWTLVNSASW